MFLARRRQLGYLHYWGQSRQPGEATNCGMKSQQISDLNADSRWQKERPGHRCPAVLGKRIGCNS
jgi:hypothetical protein